MAVKDMHNEKMLGSKGESSKHFIDANKKILVFEILIAKAIMVD